jgi:hypothetical protein
MIKHYGCCPGTVWCEMEIQEQDYLNKNKYGKG